jgi:tRNA A37 threonylcarbamoyladenosine biosynthesis protein TsaE
VAAIEWYDRLDEPLQDYLEIAIEFVGGDERRLRIAAHGAGYEAVLAALAPLAEGPESR